MSLHSEAQAYIQAAGHYYDGELLARTGHVDKRPLLFPFFVSSIHYITGYRPENVFWANSILAFATLIITYVMTSLHCGRRYGILAILLLTSLPLLAENTTGGGFEILNLCLIGCLCLSSYYYMRTPREHGLNLMILSSVLLANIRYESITYTAVPALLFLLKTYQEKRVSLSWFSAYSPLLLILPLLSIALFKSDQNFIGTTLENSFQISHFFHNFKHATIYLFDIRGNFSNSILLSASGIISILLLAFHALRTTTLLSFKKSIERFAPTVVVLTVAAFNTAFALSWWWGAWTSPETSRFSLPLQFFMVLCIPLALQKCLKIRHLPLPVLGGVLIYIAVFTTTQNNRMNKEVRLVIPAGNTWAIDWLNQNVEPTKNLIIGDATIGFGLYRYGHLPSYAAHTQPERVVLMKELGVYENIYLVESFKIQQDRQGYFPEKFGIKDRTRFTKEAIAKKYITDKICFQISRISGLNPPQSGTETLPANLPPPIPGNLEEPKAFIKYLKKAMPLNPRSG